MLYIYHNLYVGMAISQYSNDEEFQKMHLTDNHVINFKCDMGQCHMAHMSHESCVT